MSRQLRYIEKPTTINLAENNSDRIWIHETHQGINRHYKFGSIQTSSIHPNCGGAPLYNASANRTNFGLPKTIDVVPLSNHLERTKNLRLTNGR